MTLSRFLPRACAGALVLGTLALATSAKAAQPMTFYAGSLGRSAINCGASKVPAVLTVIARHGGTTWQVTQLPATSLQATTPIAADYGSATLNLPNGATAIRVVTSDVAYVLISSTCNGAAGALTYAAEDGIATVGSRFVFLAKYTTNNFVAAVTGSPHVTVTPAAGGAAVSSQTITNNTAWAPTGLTQGTVYVVDATGGDIAVGTTSINSYALLGAADTRAASCLGDTGKRFFGSIQSYVTTAPTAQTGVAVFNDGASASTVTLTQLIGGANTYSFSAPANASTYFSTLVSDGTYRFDATNPVSIWAGSPEGANAIDNLGDDIAQAYPRIVGGVYRARARAQSQARAFAAQGTVLTVNGTALGALGTSENTVIAGAQDIVVTSPNPFVLQTEDNASPTDWGKWLRPIALADSDGDGAADVVEAPTGACISVATDTDGDALPDFLDLDSDNDCIADSVATESGAARTNAALPAGQHCSGLTPVCAVSGTIGVCQPCGSDFGGGTRPCPTAGAPTCNVNGSCVGCLSNFGSGQPGPCASATQPICLANGTCAPCNGDFGSVATQACGDSTAPFCSGGQCLPCNGAFGSGAAQACKLATTPVCAVGACLQCNGGFGTGLFSACQRAAAPVCTPVGPNTGACTACNGDNGSAAAAPCPTTANPFCLAGGTCAKCTGNPDCVGHPNGAICNLTTGSCGSSCNDDTDCNQATQWCAAGGCVAKTPNGQPIPNVPPVSGQCAGNERVCLSGVCSTTDNKCGLAAGAPCSEPDSGVDGGANAECRSGICAPDGQCGSCKTDSECGTATSGKVCDDQSRACINGCRGTGGNKCPGLQVCSSTTNAVGTCGTAQADAGADAGHDAGKDSGPSKDGSAPKDASGSNDATVADGSDEGGENPDDSGVFEGGGLSCSASSSGGGASTTAGIFGLIALLGLSRRKKRD